jgi:chemotaxis protein methyltransferase WspC
VIQPVMTDDLRGIEGLLTSRIGLDPVSVGSSLIQRAARRRMKELGLEDVRAYEERVRNSEPELQALVEAVVVAESWFFRDERPFQWFREHIRAHHRLEAPAGPPLRILSLGCAAGEEPYSIAMTLLDLGLPARRFRIDAVEISGRHLAGARRGIYSPNAFRGRDLRYRDRYFRAHPDGYELSPAVRASVHFLQANILDSHLLEGSRAFDVIFCRNLLIYLSEPARARVLAAIDRLLAPEGVLVIGHADRLDSSGAAAGFRAVGGPGCFAYRRAGSGDDHTSQLPLEPLPVAAPWVASKNALTSAAADRERVPESMALPGSNDRHDSAALAPGGDRSPALLDRAASAALPRGGDPPSALLDLAANLANQGRFAEAVRACERYLRESSLDAPAYYLMGMICQAAGDRRRAEECFHKVVYLDPHHDEALLSLALLAERRGDLAAATGFRRRAERTMTMPRK